MSGDIMPFKRSVIVKKRKVIKTVLLAIGIPIVTVITAVLVWRFLPIGLNPSNMVGKESPANSDLWYIDFNEKTYMQLSTAAFSLPVQNCGVIYKENLPIAEVYTSRFKHFQQPVELKYFLIGDEVIIGHYTGAFYSKIFKFVDSNLRMPDLTVENIKKIEKCTGNCAEYFETTITGSEKNGNYISASFNEHPPKDTSVYVHKLNVLETISNTEKIQNTIKMFNQEQDLRWSDEIKADSEKFLYKVEFKDEEFPFYLIISR